MNQSLICIVEDDSDLRDVFSQVLNPLGKILTFASPADFLKHIHQHSGQMPDLVITDFSMPHMNGVQMVAEAIKLGAKFPVILISGKVDKDAAVDALNTGFCMILEKPVKSSELRETVRHLLMNHEIEKVRSEMLRVVEQMQELHVAFREMCINELELRSIDDPESVVDADGGESGTLNQALSEIEARLAGLKAQEMAALESASRAKEKLKVRMNA